MLASIGEMTLDLEQLLRVRFAYAGRFDASGGHLVFVSDLAGVPQVWGVGPNGWPELLVAPPDRAQTVYVGPRAGQLVVGADVGGDEHTQLLSTDRAGAAWCALTDQPDRIHNFGSFNARGDAISFAANTRSQRWFDVYVRHLQTGDVRRVLEHYEAQSDEEAVAEDEAAYEATTHTVMEVPVELVPMVRELIAKRRAG